MENLSASTAATNRVIRLGAAVETNGRVRALRYDQIEDCGAYLRAPEPATLYRMHGLMTGAYDVPHLAVRNRVALTNKTPTGLNRGFGGPQVFFALESLMRRIADTLGLEPLDVIRRNLVPGAAIPYRAAAGARYDSGDFPALVDRTVAGGGLDELLARRRAARREGRPLRGRVRRDRGRPASPTWAISPPCSPRNCGPGRAPRTVRWRPRP